MTRDEWKYFAGMVGLMLTGSSIDAAPLWFVVLAGFISLATVCRAGERLRRHDGIWFRADERARRERRH